MTGNEWPLLPIMYRGFTNGTRLGRWPASGLADCLFRMSVREISEFNRHLQTSLTGLEHFLLLSFFIFFI